MSVAIPPGPGAVVTKQTPDRGLVSVRWWEKTDVENGSPRISYGVDRSSCSRDIFCAWGDRSDLARLFLGYSKVVTIPGTPAVRYLSRVLPEPFPEEPWLWCASCPATSGLSRKGRSPLDVATYDVCRLEFSYGALKFGVKADKDVLAGSGPLTGFPDEGWRLLHNGIAATRYVERGRRYAYRVTTIPMGLLGWDNGAGVGGDTILEGFPIKEPEIEFTYRWREIPRDAVPEQAIGQNLFKVNQDVFDGFPAETLLYLGCEIEEHLSPWGDIVCDVLQKFSFKPNYARVAVGGVFPARGWNWKLRARDGQPLDYVKVFRKGTNEVVYPVGQFDTLFRPDQN